MNLKKFFNAQSQERKKERKRRKEKKRIKNKKNASETLDA